MGPQIGGSGGPTIRALPGSERMVGGPHQCMYHEIGGSPLALRKWRCGSVYMHVAHEPVRP